MSDNPEALRRLWPIIEKAVGGLVFTADKAGEVAADMATVRAALAQQAATPLDPLTDNYVQPVPDKCDRIVWRGAYYSLPLQAATPAPAEPDEFEVRADGERVRKDRWEVAVRRIVALLWGNRHEFEVDDVVEAVRKLIPQPFNEGDDEGLVRAVLGAAPPATPAPAEPVALTDERIDYIADLVVKGMPDGIRGFAKVWGWQQFARAILADCAGYVGAPPATPAATPAPAGWKLVPEEPTEAMHAAAVRTIVRCNGNDDFPPRVYRAMLAAAPATPAAPPAAQAGDDRPEIGPACQFVYWWPRNRNKFTTTRQAALAGWNAAWDAARAALKGQPEWQA